jgi:hypothetical protein
MVEDFYRKSKSYIKKAIGALKPKIDISRIYDDKDVLENDPDLVKDIINKYFKNILRQRTFNITKSPSWEDTYAVVQSINKEIYNEVTAPLSSQELDETIKGLPSNKAPGLSGISYELVKLFGRSAKKQLLEIFNSILTTCRIPLS